MKVEMSQMLAQMKALAVEAGARPAGTDAAGGAPGQFAGLLRASLDRVSQEQQRAAGLAEAFERGDPQVSLAQVMIARQAASIGFQAVLQARNRLVSAYQDVMDMPI